MINWPSIRNIAMLCHSRLSRLCTLRSTLAPARLLLLVTYCFLLPCLSGLAKAEGKLVIARNSSDQELFDNSLAGIVLAASRGVQVLEFNVNMTMDGELILLRESILHNATNVGEVFPVSEQQNRRLYTLDFSLAEIRQLQRKRVLADGRVVLSAPVATLREGITLIQQLERIFDRNIGMSVEPMEPHFYHKQNRDISAKLLDILVEAGYPKKDSQQLFIQSSDTDELQRLDSHLLPAREIEIPLIQLVRQRAVTNDTLVEPDNRQAADNDWLFTNIGLRLLASYASAIILPESLVFSEQGAVLKPRYFSDMRKYGVKLLISPASDDSDQSLPEGSVSTLLNRYYTEIHADGVYTKNYLSAQDHNALLEEQAQKNAELPAFFSNLNLSIPVPREKPASSKTSENTLPQD